jgi:hypothetical protein
MNRYRTIVGVGTYASRVKSEGIEYTVVGSESLQARPAVGIPHLLCRKGHPVSVQLVEKSVNFVSVTDKAEDRTCDHQFASSWRGIAGSGCFFFHPFAFQA